jgi:hypothetical protein
MSIPYVANAFRGWTKRRLVRLITKQVVNHLLQQIALLYTFDIMVQPLQPEKVRRKPEEQRAWKWFSILTKAINPELKIDSQIVVDGIAYRIDSIQPWKEAGYRRYEATEDYTGLSPMYVLSYDANGATGGTLPTGYQPIGYQKSASVPVLANTGSLAKTGKVFSGWNTAADGSGTTYQPAALLTIATADIVLYARWVAPST